MLRIGCLIVLAVLIAIPVIAARFLPGWGVLLVVLAEAAALLYGTPKLIGFAAKRLAIGLFMTKSKVLRGAAVHVHDVRPTRKPISKATPALATDEVTEPTGASPPAQDDAAEAEPPANAQTAERPAVATVTVTATATAATAAERYVLVDFALTPSPGSSKMRFYEPSELLLVPIDAKIRMNEDPTSDGQSASVSDIKVVDGAGNEQDGFDKYDQPLRFRATFACPPTLRGRVKFRYYFESFGDLLLPW
jgi:hypothetical protein